MIEKLIDSAIRFRWGVVILTLIISAFGVFQLLKLPIDAVPDITNKQVQINTVAPNLGPLDMERLVTFPSKLRWRDTGAGKLALDLAQRLFSQVTVVFEDHTDLYFARQQVAERLNQAKGTLPAGVEPSNGSGLDRAWRSPDVCGRFCARGHQGQSQGRGQARARSPTAPI
jgi:cobalt-zinc-cadmium resistance protein CzcA